MKSSSLAKLAVKFDPLFLAKVNALYFAYRAPGSFGYQPVVDDNTSMMGAESSPEGWRKNRRAQAVKRMLALIQPPVEWRLLDVALLLKIYRVLAMYRMDKSAMLGDHAKLVRAIENRIHQEQVGAEPKGTRETCRVLAGSAALQLTTDRTAPAPQLQAGRMANFIYYSSDDEACGNAQVKHYLLNKDREEENKQQRTNEEYPRAPAFIQHGRILYPQW